MTPGQYDIRIRRGSKYTLNFTINIDGTPLDLTGMSAKMQVKPTASLSSTAYVTASTVSGEITLGGALGTVDVVLSDEDTELIPVGTQYYDVIVINAGEATSWLAGKAYVTDGVTTDD